MKSNKESILEELGLSTNESKVYISLVELGSASIKDISKKSGLYRTNVYDSVRKLVEKGLAHHIEKNKKTFFGATDPSQLVSFLREKEQRLLSALPELKLAHELAVQKNTAQIFEGAPALRGILNHFLDLGEPRFIYGVPNNASEVIGKFFLENYHKRRALAKLWLKHIYNSDAKNRINHLNKLPFTESRYLPPEYDSPVATSICGDEVVLTLYSKEPVSILIKSKPIAEAYKRYFDLLWTVAKKP